MYLFLLFFLVLVSRTCQIFTNLKSEIHLHLCKQRCKGSIGGDSTVVPEGNCPADLVASAILRGWSVSREGQQGW